MPYDIKVPKRDNHFDNHPYEKRYEKRQECTFVSRFPYARNSYSGGPYSWLW